MWDLVPRPRTEPGSPALGTQRLSSWTAREAPLFLSFKKRLSPEMGSRLDMPRTPLRPALTHAQPEGPKQKGFSSSRRYKGPSVYIPHCQITACLLCLRFWKPRGESPLSQILVDRALERPQFLPSPRLPSVKRTHQSPPHSLGEEGLLDTLHPHPHLLLSEFFIKVSLLVIVSDWQFAFCFIFCLFWLRGIRILVP